MDVYMDERELFAYDAWPSRAHQPWEGGPVRGDSPWDNYDFHVDLGCGKLPKARIGVDHYPAQGVAVECDLDKLQTFGIPDAPGNNAPFALIAPPHQRAVLYHGLPFATSSIRSIISHHCFEHIGEGFIPLVDEIYRVLEPGGLLRAITPLFPSTSAVADPDHRRYFMAHEDSPGTWDSFCGTPGDDPNSCWLASFSVPYTKARFEKVDQDFTPQENEPWSPDDARELRVALVAMKEDV